MGNIGSKGDVENANKNKELYSSVDLLFDYQISRASLTPYKVHLFPNKN